jgi:hypothetical protein
MHSQKINKWIKRNFINKFFLSLACSFCSSVDVEKISVSRPSLSGVFKSLRDLLECFPVFHFVKIGLPTSKWCTESKAKVIVILPNQKEQIMCLSGSENFRFFCVITCMEIGRHYGKNESSICSIVWTLCFLSMLDFPQGSLLGTVYLSIPKVYHKLDDVTVLFKIIQWILTATIRNQTISLIPLISSLFILILCTNLQ